MATRRAAIRKKAEGAYHHGDLKSALKTAALRLVRDKGPRGFSLNEASRLAGVTVAAPYRHFADKDALLAEIACDGNLLMAREVRDAVAEARSTKDRMLAAGLGYLRFAAMHADYFAVIFNAGLDKAQFPEVERTAQEAFAVIRELAHAVEQDPSEGDRLALTAWALVHGLATLRADGALAIGGEHAPDEVSRSVLSHFVDQLT